MDEEAWLVCTRCFCQFCGPLHVHGWQVIRVHRDKLQQQQEALGSFRDIEETTKCTERKALECALSAGVREEGSQYGSKPGLYPP